MFGQGWIGCDFDGTLAVAPSPYDPTAVGAPIPKMVERVKAWLAEGKDVRIFTARVAYVSPELLVKIEAAIQKFCFDNLGKVLPVTCIKDHDMLELWDDRARQVELNTGVLIRSIPDSSLTSGTDRAMEFMRVIKQYTEAFGDPDNWPVDSRENMFEMLRSSLRDVVQKPFWSRLGIGYSNVSGQSFPEACALDAPHSLGPQGEPIYAEQGGVKRCVACECGGCIEHRYSEDQPRDPDGKFAGGEASGASAQSPEFEKQETKIEGDVKTTKYVSPNHSIIVEHNTKEGKVTVKHLDKNGDLLVQQTHDSIGAARKELQTQGIDHKFYAARSFGIQGEPFVPTFGPQGEVILVRYSPDQPRDKDGKFGSGGGREEFALAGKTCDGLTVGSTIPNQDSIGASLDSYKVREGVREIPMKGWIGTPGRGYANAAENDRCKALAEQIKESGRIDPLIVGVDTKGEPYIIEGGHRLEALGILGKNAFPALVVDDTSEEERSLRYNPDQPRDADGKFGNGGGSVVDDTRTKSILTHAGAKELLDKLNVDGLKIVGSVALKGASSHDLDLLAPSKGAADEARVKLEANGFEWMGSGGVSPKEAARYGEGKTYGDKSLWSVTDKFEHKETGEKLEVWHKEKGEDRSLRFNADQPRDDHGRFGSGESMQAAAKAWENSLDLEDTRERMSADIKAGTPENNPIIRGIREGSFTDTVFRGVVASEDWREPLDWKAGDTIQMLPSSFSTDKTVADAFAQGQVGVGVPSSPLDEDSTSVMLEVTGGGRGLSIPSSEKEIVTGGRFHIDAVAMYGEQLSIKMHQTGTW